MRKEFAAHSRLQGIRDTKAVCVMMIDVLDASGSFLGRLRNIVGSNPVIVIATKADLLPKGTDLEQVRKWLEDFIEWKRLSCLSVHLISSKTGALLCACICLTCQHHFVRTVFYGVLPRQERRTLPGLQASDDKCCVMAASYRHVSFALSFCSDPWQGCATGFRTHRLGEARCCCLGGCRLGEARCCCSVGCRPEHGQACQHPALSTSCKSHCHY
jgi:hypothetical protein